jgi:hypothetical protein
VCTNSLMMTEMIPYSWRSTSFELVNGGSTSSIGSGVERPFSPLPKSTLCEQSVRRTKAEVALSEVVSDWSLGVSSGRVTPGVRACCSCSLLTGDMATPALDGSSEESVVRFNVLAVIIVYLS